VIRFLALSLLIHLVFLFGITWKNTEVIEDPVMSFAIIENEDEPNLPPKAKPKPAGSSANSQTRTPAPPVENEVPTDTNSATSENGTGTAVGNVSVKPRVLKSFKPSYPQEAKLARIEGPVRLSVLINTEGFVQEVEVLEGPGYGLNETAQEALKKFVFSPAEKEGVKVAARIVFIYRFRLESR